MILNKDLEQAINRAIDEARNRGHRYVCVEHILYALFFHNRILKLFTGLGGSVEIMKKDLENFFKNKVESVHLPKDYKPQPTLGFQRVMQRSASHVMNAGKTEINCDEVFVAIMSENECFAKYFIEKQNINRFEVIKFLSHGFIEEIRSSSHHDSDESDYDQDRDSDEKSSKTSDKEKAVSYIESFSVDITAKAKSGKIDPVIGRASDIKRMIQILARRKKNNPILIGEAGVGKTAIVEGLALEISSNEVPAILKDAKVFELDLTGMLAGTRYRGDFEKRLKGFLKEFTELPNAILFIDEIHMLIGAGAAGQGAMDASNILKPLLSSGSIRCIGATTYKEFRKFIEPDHAMSRRFQRLSVEEPSKEDSIKILKGIKSKYEEFHQVKYSDSALKAAVDLSTQHITDRFLPDKAIDVIDEVGAIYSSERAKDAIRLDPKNYPAIKWSDISFAVAKIAKLPEQKVSKSAKDELKNLGANLKKRVFGQDEAIDALESVILLSKSGLNSQEKPIGSFVFSGPTGVGKTEMAKALADTMGIHFIRLDMSEYMEKHTVSRLIGAPPGYVGHDEGGILTDAVYKQPHCVLLLDEIEKAHPDIQNILLQIMDHGTLTDANGRKSHFQSVILILTTNVGAAEAGRESIGFSKSPDQDGKDRVLKALKNAFSPEFRNRLDAIITFNALPTSIMKNIAMKFIKEVEEKLAKKKIKLKMSDEALSWFAEKGYDKAYGARPMGRVVQENLSKPLANEILFGKLVRGGEVGIDLVDSQIKISLKPKLKSKKK